MLHKDGYFWRWIQLASGHRCILVLVYLDGLYSSLEHQVLSCLYCFPLKTNDIAIRIKIKYFPRDSGDWWLLISSLTSIQLGLEYLCLFSHFLFYCFLLHPQKRHVIFLSECFFALSITYMNPKLVNILSGI